MGPRAVALAVELSVARAKGWPTERLERELRAPGERPGALGEIAKRVGASRSATERAVARAVSNFPIDEFETPSSPGSRHPEPTRGEALTRTIHFSRPGHGGRSERLTLQPANGKEGEIEHEGG